MSTLKGSCLCGSVRFTAQDAAAHCHACHCGMCQRWGGGPLLATSCQTLSFEGTQHLSRYRSSEWAERGFCKTCGSHLFYYLLPSAQYFVPVGAFEDTTSFVLAKEIFVDHKARGYEFSGAHPRLTEAETLAAFSQAS